MAMNFHFLQCRARGAKLFHFALLSLAVNCEVVQNLRKWLITRKISFSLKTIAASHLAQIGARPSF
jgi:hypothetical protein